MTMIIHSTLSPYIIKTDLLSVRWYGLLIACAILISYFFALKKARRNNIEEQKFDGIFLTTVIMGIIGARLAFVIQDVRYYSSHLIEIFYIFDGGLSIHGALILGVVGMYLSCRKYKVNFIKLANIISPYVLLSGAIGRWGNFFNQEIIGKPSSSFIKLFISPTNRPDDFERIEFFHPVFLYESILLLSAFIIFQIFRKKLDQFALSYTLIIYSLIRISVEFFRIDYKPIFIGLDLAQIVSSVIIILTIVVGLTFRKK